MRRLFNESEKREMFTRQNGECHDCGERLSGNSEAHHVVHFAEEGETTVENGVLICKECHQVRHSKAWPMLKRFRAMHRDDRFMWQIRGLFKVCSRILQEESITAVRAVMAGGKTRFAVQAMMLARELLGIDTTIIMVPSLTIRTGFVEEIEKQCPELKIRIKLPNTRESESEIQGTDFLLVTYQEATKAQNVEYMLGRIAELKRKGWSFGFVADEVHHASAMNTWGAIKQYEDKAAHTIVQTGTAFRGDESKIEIIPYGQMHLPIVHVDYSMKEALALKNVRPVSFQFVDFTSPVTAVLSNGDTKEFESIGDIPEHEQSRVVEQQMTPGTGSLWMAIAGHVVREIEKKRADIDTKIAQALLVCQPKKEKLSGLPFLEGTGAAWKRVADQEPVVVRSENEQANELIRKFKGSTTKKYIAAINMISEGTNIPWLMVLGLFRCIKTETLFHQLVGRVMRTTCGGAEWDYGRVVLPATAEHLRFAEEFEMAKAYSLGTCDECGMLKPCECRKVCGRCGEPRPCGCPPGEGPESSPRIVDSFGIHAGETIGKSEGETAGADCIEIATNSISHSGMKVDPIRVACVLETAKRLGTIELPHCRPQESGPDRDNLVAGLLQARRKLAKHSRCSQEDSDRRFLQAIGIDHESEIDTLTRGELAKAIGTCNERTIDAIRKNSNPA
jgi:superfamily II DNA or RNA helicase